MIVRAGRLAASTGRLVDSLSKTVTHSIEQVQGEDRAAADAGQAAAVVAAVGQFWQVGQNGF